MATRKAGTVEVLVERLYPLDADWALGNPLRQTATEVVVPPGVYDLWTDGFSWWWMMTGRLNRASRRMGDGLFVLAESDGVDPDGPEVTFPSKTYGPDDWADFVDNDAVCREGAPEQRLRISVADEDAILE